MEKLRAKHLKRIIGVDQLRYLFALWVFFTHGGAPPLLSGHAVSVYYDFLDKLYGWSINGEAAVIGFFIISGLCIHYPNIEKDRINLPSFFTARLLRLSLPVLFCLLIAKLVHYHHDEGLLRAVPMWTLYCEAFYYCVYPLVFFYFKKGYFNYILIGTITISILMMIVWHNERGMPFHEIAGGGFLSWKSALIAFPCWLFGCEIANDLKRQDIIDKVLASHNNIWVWRTVAFFLSMLPTPIYRIAFYLKIINQPIIGLFISTQFTIFLYSVFSFFWVRKELILINFGNLNTSKLLERFGLASFSLYVVHTLVLWLFKSIGSDKFPGYLIMWLFLVGFLHIFTYLFYKLVESPSHKVAKYLSGLLK